jgi:hypothetical protein
LSRTGSIQHAVTRCNRGLQKNRISVEYQAPCTADRIFAQGNPFAAGNTAWLQRKQRTAAIVRGRICIES